LVISPHQLQYVPIVVQMSSGVFRGHTII
jgi:hypothetical protein